MSDYHTTRFRTWGLVLLLALAAVLVASWLGWIELPAPRPVEATR